MGAVAPLRLIQLGKETVRGTEVNATSRLLTRPGMVKWRDKTDKPPVESDWGVLARRHSSALSQVTRQLTEVEMTADLSFEQILYPLLGGIKGGVTPAAQAGGADGQLWTFTPGASVDPAPDAFTLEYVEKAGATVIQQLTAKYGLCKRIRISATDAPDYATMEMDWFANHSVSKAPTASIGLPTRHVVPGHTFGVLTASTFAGLSAGTPLAGQVIGFDWELVTGVAEKFRLDDGTDFTVYQFGIREMTLKVTIDLTAESELERATFLDAEGIRYMRLRVNGPAIGAATHKIIIDGSYEITDPVEMGSDTDGQSSIELTYHGIFDATKDAQFEVSVQNTLATLP